MHMKNNQPRLGVAAVLGGAFLLGAAAATADVTTEHRITVQGVGIMAAGNMTGTTRRAVSGSHSRSDNDLQLQSRLVRMLAHGAGGASAEIVDLDAGQIYHLDVNKKTYTQSSFEDVRARLQKALDQGANDTDNAARTPSAVDESKCEWLPPKTDVKRTGEKGQFAGFDAERVVISAEQPCKDKQTGAICEVALTLDEWVSPQFGPSDELLKFQRAYAQKLGLDAAFQQDVADRARSLFGRYKGVWQDLGAKLKDVKGYPVKSSFALGVGGDQCQQAQSAQQQTGSSGGDKGSTSPGALASQAAAKLGSLLHHKKDETQAPQGDSAGAATAGPGGTVNLMTLTSELLSVSTNPVPATVFSVPADFKKVEPPARSSN
jgi:hypothetical protein